MQNRDKSSLNAKLHLKSNSNPNEVEYENAVNAIVRDPDMTTRILRDESGVQQKLKNKFTVRSALRKYHYGSMINDTLKFYDSLISQNNAEFVVVKPKSTLKPIKVLNLLSIKGNDGTKCKGDCAAMTSDQVNLNNTAVNKKVYKIDWGSCKQHKFETIYNNGINNNMSPCFIKKEEQICQNEVDESLKICQMKMPFQYQPHCGDYNLMDHGDDWKCAQCSGTRQSPIDLPNHKKLADFYHGKTKEIIESVPEVLDCINKKCTDSYDLLVNMVDLVTTWNRDYVTYSYNNGYYPLTSNNFAYIQGFNKMKSKILKVKGKKERKEGNTSGSRSTATTNPSKNILNAGHGVYYYGEMGYLVLKEGIKHGYFKFHNFSFKTPSEHTIEGNMLDMELQITFIIDSSLTKKWHSNFVIISILFQEGEYENLFLRNLDLKDLPHNAGYIQNFTSKINFNEIMSFSGREMGDKFTFTDYFMYNGSFTIPDCAEDVVWIVNATPALAKFNQIHTIRQKLAWGYDQIGNNRKTQNPNGRNVWYHNEAFNFMESFQQKNYDYRSNN